MGKDQAFEEVGSRVLKDRRPRRWGPARNHGNTGKGKDRESVPGKGRQTTDEKTRGERREGKDVRTRCPPELSDVEGSGRREL